MEEEKLMITLDFEDGSTVECEILGTFDVDDKVYAALIPEDEEEIMLYRYASKGEEFELQDIEDDEEYDRVSDAFDALMAQQEEE